MPAAAAAACFCSLHRCVSVQVQLFFCTTMITVHAGAISAELADH